VRDAEHTPVPSHRKIPGFWGKRNIPQNYYGMSDIPGGVVKEYSVLYTRYGLFTETTGIIREFLLFPPPRTPIIQS